MHRYAAILLSRQALRPSASTVWVRQLLAALDWLRSGNFTIISSVGMPTWEMICAAAGLREMPQVVIVPENGPKADDHETIRAGFALGRVSFHSVRSSSREAFMAARDDVVFDLADLLVPVSVRPAGSIAKRLAKCRLDGRSVIDRFEVPYDARGQRLKYTIGESLLNPVNDDLSHRYLIHWTRTSNGPWPDERPIDYYRSVLASPTYPRSALDTLLRILQTRRFIASGRHLPHNVRAVSFSDLPPRQVIRLMRWRARYREMSFEPYGLGVEISAARSLGIQPVIYYDPDVADVPLAEDRWRWQSAGAVGDWVKEGEYRHLGDLDFSRIPHDALLAFCCRPSEAPAITKASGIPCVPILAEDQATLR